jgi:coenzyme F420-reducing hydrogenase alpha subunit
MYTTNDARIQEAQNNLMAAQRTVENARLAVEETKKQANFELAVHGAKEKGVRDSLRVVDRVMGEKGEMKQRQAMYAGFDAWWKRIG